MSEKEVDPKKIIDVFHQFRLGACRLTKQKFRNALKRSIGADKDYSDGCWTFFQDTPLHYVCSRNPKSQSLELIKVCMKIGGRP